MVAESKQPARTPATVTARFKRLLVVLWLVYAIVCYFFVTILNFISYVCGSTVFDALKYSLLSLICLLVPLIVCLANLIAKIYETPKNNGYKKQAMKKLQESSIQVVGITGSYGKTSAKVILTAMLSKRYKVLSTPRSHNTPMGLSLALNGARIQDYDIFVAEMGARNVGDIKELCELCPPDYSLITGICSQHLESFGTLENIVKAKSEIITATKNKTFVASDAYDNFASFGEKIVKCNCVSDVVADRNGTTFKLTLGGEIREVSCKLLGEHSAYNIGLCAQVAYELGVSLSEIAEAVAALPYIEHRLELIQNNGINIIDDGYNSNVKGADAALKVLNYFPERRIVVTPGLIELGVLEKKENSALGARLAGYDFVILVGDTLVGTVKDGYLAAGGDKNKIVTVPNLFAAQDKLKEILKTGDTVLFLNDLPDVYM
jgi:UDP-N-acetylmuramoyl-tripeptide--D-alanyl-D-alanine ligase